ncbi:MAG: c-type cytochrome [Desulfobacterales bacterium]|nr:c-type cytochrome [Desulfobacterales bacterium]
MKKIIGFFIVVAILLLAVYHALIYYDNNFRYGRMRETPAVRPYEEPLLIKEAGLVPVNGGEAIFRVSAGIDIQSPLDMTQPAAINRGKAVYLIYCAQCHGHNHDGKGTVGQSFAPLPTDLRSAKVQNSPAGVLFKNVSYGIPDGRQPPLHATVTADDRWRVVAYVKSLGTRE